jgi:hypothetical protein
MSYIKVSSREYTLIGDHFNAWALTHCLFVDNDSIGYMEEVEREEDRMYFDFFIREDYYNLYQLASKEQ